MSAKDDYEALKKQTEKLAKQGIKEFEKEGFNPDDWNLEINGLPTLCWVIVHKRCRFRLTKLDKKHWLASSLDAEASEATPQEAIQNVLEKIELKRKMCTEVLDMVIKV